MGDQITETGQFEQVLPHGRLVDDFMFKNPSEVMRDKDGVEPRRQRRVDVGARAIADHPRRTGLAAMVGAEREIGLRVFFREHFDRREMLSQTRPAQLPGLLFGIALGHEDKPVAGGEFGESMSDHRQKFNLLVGNSLGEALNTLVFLGSNGSVGKLLEALDERVAEAVEAVAISVDTGMLDAVEMLANLFWSVDAVVQIRDEGGDRALEVNVVLPKSIVCIDKESLRI